MGNTAKWAKFAGKRVSPDLVEPLNRLRPETLACIKPRVTQGVGDAAASKGTHKSGHCIDVSTRDLTRDLVRKCVSDLQRVGFAVVLRLRGELEPNNPEHLHAALRGHANSALVHSVTGFGGPHHIDTKLARR